jgi:hypothetical protein
MGWRSGRDELEKAKGNGQVGWAFQAMERAFEWLIDDYDFQVGDVRLHQDGLYLSLVSPNASLVVTYEEWWNGFSAAMALRNGDYVNLWDLLAEHDVRDTWLAPDRKAPMSRQAAVQLLFRWANGLKGVAAEHL